MYKTEDLVLPVSDLSSGYQSLIWMVFDIAYRMAILNPNKRSEVCATKGIVLIDEIDMHLHPKWQWNIIDSLRKTFPNVQFIATTHSPILFASAKDVWIIDIELHCRLIRILHKYRRKCRRELISFMMLWMKKIMARRNKYWKN